MYCCAGRWVWICSLQSSCYCFGSFVWTATHEWIIFYSDFIHNKSMSCVRENSKLLIYASLKGTLWDSYFLDNMITSPGLFFIFESYFWVLFLSQICMHLSNFIVSLWPQSIDSRLHCRYNWIYSGYEALDILSRKIFELSCACNIIPYKLTLALFVTEMSYRC